MTNVDVRRLTLASALFFGLMLLWDRISSSGDGKSLGHSVVSCLVATVVFAALTAVIGGYRTRTTPQPTVVLDDETAQRVDALVAEGKHVTAVKAVRDATGADLRSAKATVDDRSRVTQGQGH